MATLSAQIPRVLQAFSTLHPIGGTSERKLLPIYESNHLRKITQTLANVRSEKIYSINALV